MQRKLRDWMAKPEAKILISVVESQAKKIQAGAVSEAMSKKGALAEITMQDADRYEQFLKIWQHILTPTTPLETIKLK